MNNIYFSLGFFEALDSKGIFNSLEKGMASAMECADVAAFTFARWQIRLCLLGMLISLEATVVAVKTAQAFLSRVNNEFIYGNLISFFASIFHS